MDWDCSLTAIRLRSFSSCCDSAVSVLSSCRPARSMSLASPRAPCRRRVSPGPRGGVLFAQLLVFLRSGAGSDRPSARPGPTANAPCRRGVDVRCRGLGQVGHQLRLGVGARHSDRNRDGDHQDDTADNRMTRFIVVIASHPRASARTVRGRPRGAGRRPGRPWWCRSDRLRHPDARAGSSPPATPRRSRGSSVTGLARVLRSLIAASHSGPWGPLAPSLRPAVPRYGLRAPGRWRRGTAEAHVRWPRNVGSGAWVRTGIVRRGAPASHSRQACRSLR